ncbi:MAG: hypothetical protein FWG92_01425 [Leptospirales bacterium]|nr:hypothetical protein [Leptospirales bacterium]
MKAFFKGMDSVELFPNLSGRQAGQGDLPALSAETAWREVGQAFQAVGNSIRAAINEQK